MKGQGTEIWKKEEYSYEGAHGFIPVMVSYMHEDDKIHPAMIVVPGGGYRQVSRTEAHLVAMDFYEADYNVFVLVYTVNPLDEVPLGMQPSGYFKSNPHDTRESRRVPDHPGEDRSMRIFCRRAFMCQFKCALEGYKRSGSGI